MQSLRNKTKRTPNLLSLLALFVGIPAFGQDGGYAVSVESAEVTASAMESSVTAVGTIIAEASATLRAEVPGQIKAVHFR